MEDEVSNTLIYSALEMVMFCMALSLVIYLCSMATKQISKVEDKTEDKITVSVSGDNANYNNYGYMDGNIQYDGTMKGSVVFEDILNAEDDTVIRLSGESSSLNSQIVNGTPFLEYVRITNSKNLSDKLQMTETYTRYYQLDSNGNILQVVYKLI